MRNIDFKELNCDFSPSPQTALSVTFVAHDQNPKSCFLFDAKSPENVAFFVRGHTPDALWGIGAFSAILSEASVAPASAAPGQDFPAQCRLCTSRFVVGVDLRSGSRSASDQQDRTASVQRCVSGFVGIGPFSKPNNLAPVASAAVASKHSAIGGSARSAACSVPGSAHSALQSDPGPGLCGADALRPPARSPSRLQPQKEGASLVSSSALLRSLPGKGAFGSLVGQRSFFSHRVVCLRSGTLVQAVLSAHPIQNSDSRNGPERFLRFASTYGKSGRTKCAPTPKRLRPSRGLLVRISQSERSANFKKNVIL